MIKHNGITINKVYKAGAVDNKAYFNGSVVYGSGSVPPTPPGTDDYLTFTVLSNGIINWWDNNKVLNKVIEYNKNNAGWNEICSSGDTINVVTGDVVKFRGKNSTYATAGTTFATFSGTTCSFNLSGHIYTLTDYESKSAAASSAANRTYEYMFRTAPVVDASNLILADADYHPSLDQNYMGLFYGCSGLTAAPSLKYCKCGQQGLGFMFRDCSSLATAPEMPDDSGSANTKYSTMFMNCTALTKVVIKSTDTLTGQQVCGNLCRGCTSLTEAEILPAQTPAKQAFNNSFSGCSALNSVKYMMLILPTTSYNGKWLTSVASTGTLTLNSNATGTLTDGADGKPINWVATYITP